MMKQWTALLIFCVALLCLSAARNTCSYKSDDGVQQIPASGFTSQVDHRQSDTVQCNDTDHCIALLKPGDDPAQARIIAQGCWISSDERECSSTSCVPHSNENQPDILFCCCSGYLCNQNVTHNNIETTMDNTTEVHPTLQAPAKQHVYYVPDEKKTLVIIIVSVCCLVVIILGIWFGHHVWSRNKKPPPNSLNHMEVEASTPLINLDNLKLNEAVGRGRYGVLWHGSLNSQSVAVKVFPAHHMHIFLNERDIYTLPFMENPTLLSYLGSQERLNPDGHLEFLLVLSYMQLGCLQDYLRKNVVSWSVLCRMLQSITSGLAHLHTDIRKGDTVKLCVSHRDLNTRNILVRSDLSCCLCDFGFAMKIQGSKYYVMGEEQHAETASLTDVGTLRYMAPEVLEGAVNLRDCESSLKQIDIYALGLVMWEVASRCTDLYQGAEVPSYKLPFEAEIGPHPSFEQMQVLITRKKARPLFPKVWKNTNAAVRQLKETIEDCWDQDADARLTALCVEERLQELPVLWDRHRASMTGSGVSPTLNSVGPNLVNNEVNDMKGPLVDVSEPPGSQRLSLSWKDRPDSTVSEVTAESSVTLSPSEPVPVTAKNEIAANTQKPFGPIQPYQGRNPCIERNLMVEDENLTMNGNALVERSAKHTNSPYPVLGGYDNVTVVDSTESNSLVNHDSANLQNQAYGRSANPIPYVQNAVHDMPVVPTQPKQPNVPGNGWKVKASAKPWSLKNFFSKWKKSSDMEEDKSNEAFLTPINKSLYTTKSNLHRSPAKNTCDVNCTVETQVLLSDGLPTTTVVKETDMVLPEKDSEHGDSVWASGPTTQPAIALRPCSLHLSPKKVVGQKPNRCSLHDDRIMNPQMQFDCGSW